MLILFEIHCNLFFFSPQKHGGLVSSLSDPYLIDFLGGREEFLDFSAVVKPLDHFFED